MLSVINENSQKWLAEQFDALKNKNTKGSKQASFQIVIKVANLLSWNNLKIQIIQ